MNQTTNPDVKPTPEQLQTRLDAIVALARRHCTPAVNMGAHILARKILELAGEKE